MAGNVSRICTTGGIHSRCQGLLESGPVALFSTRSRMRHSSPAFPGSMGLMNDCARYKIPQIIGFAKNDCQIDLCLRDCDANRPGNQMVIKTSPSREARFPRWRPLRHGLPPGIESDHIHRSNAGLALFQRPVCPATAPGCRICACRLSRYCNVNCGYPTTNCEGRGRLSMVLPETLVRFPPIDAGSSLTHCAGQNSRRESIADRPARDGPRTIRLTRIAVIKGADFGGLIGIPLSI